MERTEDKNMDEEDEAGNSGEEDDIQIRLAAPAPFYFPNHFKNKEMYSLLWLWISDPNHNNDDTNEYSWIRS